MNWLILDNQEQLDELNERMKALLGNDKPYSNGEQTSIGIAVYIHECVKIMLTPEEMDSLQNYPHEEIG